MSDRAGEYIVGLFGAEDELLSTLREEADRTGLPPIAISSDEGRLLQVLLTAINARRVRFMISQFLQTMKPPKAGERNKLPMIAMTGLQIVSPSGG